MFADNRRIPLVICNFGFLVKFIFFLNKTNITNKTITTVKKYLAHTICRTGKEKLKYLAKPSIIGRIIHADKFKNIAFIEKTIY